MLRWSSRRNSADCNARHCTSHVRSWSHALHPAASRTPQPRRLRPTATWELRPPSRRSEIGGGLLGGYVVSRDDEPDEGTFSPMLAVPGGILLVDAIIALGLYLSNDN